MSEKTYQLSLLKVPVNDIELSAKFYELNLGFQVEFVAQEYGWAQMKSGEISIALYRPGMGGGEREIGGSVDFHLKLENSAFDEIADRLLNAGMLSENMVHKGEDGTSFIDILDPDNNVIKVFRSR